MKRLRLRILAVAATALAGFRAAAQESGLCGSGDILDGLLLKAGVKPN